MALVSVIFGGTIGFAAAMIALLCGVSGVMALAIWSGTGLAITATLVMVGLFPRPPVQAQLAAENA